MNNIKNPSAGGLQLEFRNWYGTICGSVLADSIYNLKCAVPQVTVFHLLYVPVKRLYFASNCQRFVDIMNCELSIVLDTAIFYWYYIFRDSLLVCQDSRIIWRRWLQSEISFTLCFENTVVFYCLSRVGCLDMNFHENQNSVKITQP
jgi:predicted membrane protein